MPAHIRIKAVTVTAVVAGALGGAPLIGVGAASAKSSASRSSLRAEKRALAHKLQALHAADLPGLPVGLPGLPTGLPGLPAGLPGLPSLPGLSAGGPAGALADIISELEFDISPAGIAALLADLPGAP